MPDQLTPYSDFSHPGHVPTPTPKGIQYPVGMTPQAAARILDKAGRKGIIGQRGAKGKGGGRGRGKPVARGAKAGGKK